MHQWGLKKAVKDINVSFSRNGDLIYYELSTMGGQSGAPILRIDKNKETTIIGVHVGVTNRRSSQMNFGRLITPKMIDMLRGEASNLNAIPFDTDEPEEQKWSIPVWIDRWYDTEMINAEEKCSFCT